MSQSEEREEKNNVIKNGATEYKLCVKSKSTVELRKIYSKNAINGKSKIQIYDYISHNEPQKSIIYSVVYFSMYLKWTILLDR